MTKEYAYQDNPVLTEVYIAGKKLLEQYVGEIGDISHSSDYPRITEYRVGEVTFTLNDPEGIFSPNKTDNFFVNEMQDQSGRNAPVEIKAGFLVGETRYLQTVFSGRIIRIRQSGRQGTLKVTCSDNFREIRKPVNDFGIERRFRIYGSASEDQGNVAYPVMKGLMPASKDSVEIYKDSANTIEPVDSLTTEGHLDANRFVSLEDRFESEGGPIPISDANISNYPQVSLKSPYRYADAKAIIQRLMNGTGISVSIDIPKHILEDSHFSSNGRPNYELIGVTETIRGKEYPSNPSYARWDGYITDWLHIPVDSTQSRIGYYFLYNSPDTLPGLDLFRSAIIKYDKTDKIYTREYVFDPGIKVWKIVNKTDNPKGFYVIVTDEDDKAKIVRIALSGGSYEEHSVSTGELSPYIHHYYVGVGVTRYKQDTRRSFIYHNNKLYYVFSHDEDRDFGVARLETPPSIVVAENFDERGNHAGIDFDIVGSYVVGALTFGNDTNSKVSAFRKAI